MLACEQTKGQTVYQHGLSVLNHFLELKEYLADGNSPDHWRIPDWLKNNREEILNYLHNEQVICEYLLYHDCGKPICRMIDENGKVHFPDHAQISKTTFLNAGGKPTVANLIGWDMEIHTASAEQIANYCDHLWSIQDAFTLLLASLAEIHSNAKMFGGIESISFKSKWKKIDQRGRQICKHFLGEPACLN